MATDRWDGWARGWRGPALAAGLALAAGAPGAFAVPPLDRDEARFAQATTQMLDSGDVVNISFQDQPRHKKPVGVHWLQALSVALVTEPESRPIWAYRLPSLIGAMLAAAACAWGARTFFGPGLGLAAGAILGVCALLSFEAGIAKTDALLCGAVTLALAALGRLYGAARGIGAAGRRVKALFWGGLALSILLKGPIGPMVVGATLLALWGWDRELGWAKRLGWWWGLLACLALFGPWALAITVATDGAFWTEALGGDLAPKLQGGHESHGGLPGYHLLAAPFVLFPATLLLPAALALAWRRRREPGVRFAIAWVLPAWILFELSPTKLVHYPLPLYGGLAWLLAAALAEPRARWERVGGAALSVVAGLAFAGVALYGLSEYGDARDVGWAAGAAGLFAAAGLTGAVALLGRASRTALALTALLAVAAHGVLAAGLIPRLEPLWLSDRTSHALARAGLHPRGGGAPSAVTAAGYAEPSLVFELGAQTELGGPDQAAEALSDGRVAIVEARELPAFRRAADRLGLTPEPFARVGGVNYSKGDATTLHLYRPDPR